MSAHRLRRAKARAFLRQLADQRVTGVGIPPQLRTGIVSRVLGAVRRWWAGMWSAWADVVRTLKEDLW